MVLDIEQFRDTSDESFQPRYDLDLDDIAHLTAELLEDRGQDVPEQYRYIAVEVDGRSKFANIGRTIERTVFEDRFGNDADEMVDEYLPYDNASTFFLSIDRHTGTATGVLRVIKNSEAGLKSYDDALSVFRVDPQKAAQHAGMDDMDKVWDVGTIAVLPEYRGKDGPVAILLERAMYKSAKEHDVQSLLSIIDKKALTKLRSKWRGVGIPFVPFGGSKPRDYIGSGKSYAVHGFVPEFYEKMSRHRESLRGRMLAKYALGDALDRLIEGTADDAIVLDEAYKN